MKSRKRAPKAAVKGPASTSGNQTRRAAGPSLEEVRLRAYELYVERGRTDGREIDDWLQAEKELTKNIRKRPLE